MNDELGDNHPLADLFGKYAGDPIFEEVSRNIERNRLQPHGAIEWMDYIVGDPPDGVELIVWVSTKGYQDIEIAARDPKRGHHPWLDRQGEVWRDSDITHWAHPGWPPTMSNEEMREARDKMLAAEDAAPPPEADEG